MKTHVCPTCQGNGSFIDWYHATFKDGKWHKPIKTCPDCKGTGKLPCPHGYEDWDACPTCNPPRIHKN